MEPHAFSPDYWYIEATFTLEPPKRVPLRNHKLRFNRARARRNEYIEWAGFMLEMVERITRFPADVLTADLKHYHKPVTLNMRSYALEAIQTARAELMVKEYFPDAETRIGKWIEAGERPL